MAVLERSELEASPLADLHAIADQLGLDGFRRLRKGDLIEAILARDGEAPEARDGDGEEQESDDGEREPERQRRSRRRGGRSARGRRGAKAEDGEAAEGGEDAEDGEDADAGEDVDAGEDADAGGAATVEGERREQRGRGEVADGLVEVLPNGSGFLRVSPPEPSDE